MPTISPIIRITIGLLLLTISILLIGDMLGVVPNQIQAKIDARKTMSESLAIQISSEVGTDRIENAVFLLNTIVDRNDDILSMALREASKKIIMQTPDHKNNWELIDDDQSSTTNVQVPIFNKSGRWGTLEVCYKPLGGIIDDLLNGRSLITMILFIVFSGFLGYWIFLKRVLSELDPGSVVPDRVRAALDTLMEGLVILDQSERIIFVNKAFKNKLGFSEEQLMGKSLSSLEWKLDDDTLSLENKKMPWTTLFESEESPKMQQLRLTTTSKESLVFDVNVAPIKEPNQKIKGAIVTIDDITELEKKNKELGIMLSRLEQSKAEISRQNLELVELATKDPLTSLFNRRALFENFDELLLDAKNSADIISCVILDIDHFKLVNDTYGHGVGDDVLKIFAKILQDSVRANDLVGRYGGEEFVLVMPGMTEEEAAFSADRVRLQICEKVHKGLPKDLWIASSFGVSSTSTGKWKSDSLIDLADKALYVAKDSGRNRVVRYSQIDLDHTQVEDVTPKPSLSRQEVQAAEEEIFELIAKEGNIPIESYSKVGVLSRTVIIDRLTQATKIVKRDGSNLTILTISIDNLQTISNAIGYSATDKLRKIAFECLVDTFRSSDSVIPDMKINKNMGLSRSSDSEFVAILPSIEQPAITTWVVTRMLKDLTTPVIIDGNEIVMTASVGGSVYPVDGEKPEELLRNSNIALQKVSREESGNFLFYNHEMNLLCKHELEVESQLHQALHRDEFYLDYQPIISVQTGRVEKFEALVRWKHPSLGLVSPESFIGIAENAGIIKEIGSWIALKACHQLKAWHMEGYEYLKISINLSAVQFHNLNLAEDLIEIAQEVGVKPSSIVLEMTETILLKEHNDVMSILTKLNDVGFQIALDDFGTGYSSLEYLRKFPISIIKIDRSLIDEFPENAHDLSIVSALISLAHNLNISVIAEGVESEVQLKALVDLSCDEIQGYFISRPLLLKHISEFLNSVESKKIMRKASSAKRKLLNESETIALGDILNVPPSY